MNRKRDGRAHHSAATHKVDQNPTEMVPPAADYPGDWRESLRERTAATAARRARREAGRREFEAAREYGLRARHAEKMRRTGRRGGDRRG